MLLIKGITEELLNRIASLSLSYVIASCKH